MTKLEALAKYLECETDDLTQTKYDDNAFTLGHKEYLVLTDDEADEAVKEHILDSLWAFNPNFLASHSDLDESDFESIQANNKYEDNNKIIRKLINDLDHFVNDAIIADGRGHFLSGYDGEEIEMGEYYIYRTN